MVALFSMNCILFLGHWFMCLRPKTNTFIDFFTKCSTTDLIYKQLTHYHNYYFNLFLLSTKASHVMDFKVFHYKPSYIKPTFVFLSVWF